jgi:hypothetical protein
MPRKLFFQLGLVFGEGGAEAGGDAESVLLNQELDDGFVLLELLLLLLLELGEGGGVLLFVFKE